MEYFSKQLGEKTIGRDSISVNKDKQNHKTGKSVSDQVMARALMTPDELRRLDNDLCIIFEKGIRPIKARKFYYFEHPMAKEMKRYAISHNDIGEIERGPWRKYNPYNPYVPEEDEQKKVDNLKVESLDDLFEDDEKEKEDKPQKELQTVGKITEKNENSGFQSLDLKNNEPEAPVLPQDDNDYDLQKELEAKFDELFGPLDDED